MFSPCSTRGGWEGANPQESSSWNTLFPLRPLQWSWGLAHGLKSPGSRVTTAPCLRKSVLKEFSRLQMKHLHHGELGALHLCRKPDSRHDCPQEKGSLGKVPVQPKHSKGLEVENTSWIIHPLFPFSRVSSRDRGRECPPPPRPADKLFPLPNNLPASTSGPRMLCACWLQFPCWLGITTGIGALSSKGRCWRCHHSKPGGFGVPGPEATLLASRVPGGVQRGH